MLRFAVGAIVGGIVVWYLSDALGTLADRTEEIRRSAADTLKSVEKTAESVLDRTKEQVSSALQAGQDVIAPRHAAR